MANAIKTISVARGYDVTRYALNCFGGAGGQHACLVADALGMSTILVHPLSGLLSAYGMGLADIRATREKAVEEPLGPGAIETLARYAAALGKEAAAEVEGQGIAGALRSGFMRVLIVRYLGTDTPLEVPLPSVVGSASEADIRAAFEAAHRRRFGFVDPGKALMVEALSVEAVGGGAAVETGRLAAASRSAGDGPSIADPASIRFFSQGSWHDARALARDRLQRGNAVDGPALIVEPHQTVVVEDGWRAGVDVHDNLVLRAQERRAREPPSAPMPIPSCWRCSTTCSWPSPNRWE